MSVSERKICLEIESLGVVLNYFICIVQRQCKDSGAVNFTAHGSEVEFLFCIIQTFFFLSVFRWVLDMALRKCQSRHLFLVYKSLFNNFKVLTTTKKWSTNTLVLIFVFCFVSTPLNSIGIDNCWTLLQNSVSFQSLRTALFHFQHLFPSKISLSLNYYCNLKKNSLTWKLLKFILPLGLCWRIMLW